MKLAALILNILLLIGFLPSCFGAIMSPMISDSGVTSRTWMIMIAIFILPILIIITQIFSWIAYSKNNYNLAFKISLIPVADVLFLVILFLYSDKLM